MSDKPKGASSNFVSGYGIIALVILFIIAAYFRLEGLPLFLLVIITIAVLCYVWGRYSLDKLRIDVIGTSSRVFPDEDVVFSFSIENEKMLPLLYLEIDYFDQVPDFLNPDEDLTNRITWLMSYQKISSEVRIRAKKRGVAILDSVTATSGDGFGLSTDSRHFALDDKYLIVVYPRVFSVDASDLIRDTIDMHAGDRGYMDDYTLFRGSRDYLPGDSIRFINWRLLARQGELNVNLYEPLVPQSITFLLDLKSFTVWREEINNAGAYYVLETIHEDLMEDMISLTASLIIALTEKKVKCTLVIPLYGDRGEMIVRSENIETQVPDLLTALAAISYKGEDAAFSKDEILRNSNSFGQVYAVGESANAFTCMKILDGLDEYQTRLLVRDSSEEHHIYKTIGYEELGRKYE